MDFYKEYRESARDVYEWIYTKGIQKKEISEGTAMNVKKINTVIMGNGTISEFMLIHEFCKNFSPNR